MSEKPTPNAQDAQIVEAAILEKGYALGSMDRDPIKVNGHKPVVMVPYGYDLQGLPEQEKVRPDRKKGVAVITDLASFISLVNAHKSKETEIYADGHKLVAVLNSHSQKEPGHCDLRIEHKLEYSSEYAAWKDVIGTKTGQTTLAELLEDYVHTVAKPDGTDLANMAKNLQITKKCVFWNDMDLHNGNVKLEYNQETKQGNIGEKGVIEIPNEVTLVLPVFKGGSPHQVELRLRYRLHDGSVSFWFSIKGSDEFESAIVDSVLAKVAAETKLPVYRGRHWTWNY